MSFYNSVINCLQYKSYKICSHSVAIAEKYACLKTFVAIVKKNPACLNDLVNSRQPVITGKKKQSLLRRKEKAIKHQVRKCRLAFPKNLKRQPNHQIGK